MMFTLFKLCLVCAAVAGGFALLKKNGLTGSGGRATDILQETAKKLMHEKGTVEEPKGKMHAYGRYLLNVLDGTRVCIPLEDMRLQKGEGIVISEHGEPSNNPHVLQTIALGKYTNLAKELRGSQPIQVFRDGKNGEVYIRFDPSNRCFRQESGADTPVEFRAEGAIKIKEVSKYGSETLFWISGLPIAFSLNPVYCTTSGELRKTPELHKGTTFIDIKDIPKPKNDSFHV